MRRRSTNAALYLAVLPFYRDACMAELLRRSDGHVQLFAGSRHIDKTVTTGIDRSLYTPVRNIVIADRLLLQLGHWGRALEVENLIVDLNPRSLTAWMLLLARRLLSRRTLVWGHLHPRAGAGSSTARVRRLMRRIASGTILYGYDSVKHAVRELPAQQVWVAPNALYRAAELGTGRGDVPRYRVTYVGRLEASKKVDLLVRAFAASGLRNGCRLTVVGFGSELEALRSLSVSLGVGDSVDFTGELTEASALSRLYSESIVSVSPGYVGLSITQSLGFGVPMIIARDEPHAPEIELHRFGGVTFFRSDSVDELARALERTAADSSTVDRPALSARVVADYSAEAMAAGLLAALSARPQELNTDDHWPKGSEAADATL